ncbi:hypothetical protein FKP32DRAFT_1680528 [Trametes sanguinea]|nr:hypothetical protein FKP32DRAFT_1680528 [Trametes sanguinea]
MSLFPSSGLPQLDNTLGAWLLGTFFGTLLQGTVYHQAYRYSRLYPNDPMYLKLWVLVVVLIETLNTALTWHSSYVYLIKNFANPIALLGAPVWSMSVLPIPGSLAAVVSQAFFARRLYMINRRYTPIAIVAMACFLSFAGFYIGLSIRSLKVHNLPESLTFSWMASTGSSIMMAGDFLVTSVLIYALQKSRTGIPRTDSLLDLLIVYAVSTGFIICVFNALNVAFAFAFPSNLIYSAFSIILTKLYANTLLVALNTRKSLVSRGIIGENETSPFMSTILRRQKASAVVIAHRNTSQITTTAMPSDSATIELKMVSDHSEPSQLALGPNEYPHDDKYGSTRGIDAAATV